MSEERRPAPQMEMGTGRVEAFSDGVMAVIITIMAFELRAPNGATLDAVRRQLPSLAVYVLSFAAIAIYWNNHHHLLRAAERISGAAMWLCAPDKIERPMTSASSCRAAETIIWGVCRRPV